MKKTRRSLITSLVTLLLCSAMFVGSSFAWFTDTVSNTGNKIQAGTLDVELWQKIDSLSTAQSADEKVKAITEEGYTEYSNISDSIVAVFNYDKWEPGYATSLPFAVVNVGNLAFKYNVYFYITEETAGTHETSTPNSLLSNVIKVYKGTSREDTKDETNYLGTLADFTKEGATGHKISGKLLPKGSTKKLDDEQVYIASSNLVFIMPETAGNEYQGASLTFDIRVEATQYTYEKDGFGSNLYDDNSTLEPDSVQPSYATSKIENDKPTTFVVRDDNVAKEVGKNTTIEFEAGALIKEDEKPGDTEIEIIATPILTANANSSFDIEVGNSSVGAIDLTVKVDGEEVHDFNGMTAKVITYIAKGLTLGGETDLVDVKYKGEKSQPTDVTYDSETGLLTFKTNHFSQFLIDADQIAYIEENNTAYDTLYDAINAVNENNKTVYLLQNISGVPNKNYEIGESKDMVLDLNGHTFNTIAEDGSKAYTIENYGTLKIKDSTDINKDGTGKGKLEMNALNPDLDPVPGYASNVITNKGILTVESGWIHNASSEGSAAFAIDNSNNSSLYIKGGKFTTNSSATIRQYGINCDVVITGGYFASEGGLAYWLQDGTQTNLTGSVNISNAVFDNNIKFGWGSTYSKGFEVIVSNSVVKGDVLCPISGYTSVKISNCVVDGDIAFADSNYVSENNDVKGLVYYGVIDTCYYIFTEELLDGIITWDQYETINDCLITGKDYEIDLKKTDIDISTKTIAEAWYCVPYEGWDDRLGTKIDEQFVHFENGVLKIDGAGLRAYQDEEYLVGVVLK